MVYVYDQDIQAVIDWLKASAKNDAPPGFDYANLAEIPLKDSRPQGFIARYTDVQGELKVVFLALNLGQENLIAAAMASAPPKS